MCLVTHADPRCVVSCIILNYAIKLLKDGSNNILMKSVCEGLSYLDGIKINPHRSRGIPEKWVDKKYITKNGYDYKGELLDVYKTSKDLYKLDLDEIGKIGYTYKCLGCAMWAMRLIDYAKENKKVLPYIKFIKILAKEGGDADTNAVVAGALFGTYLGYKNLYKQAYKEIRSMPHIKWLMGKIEKYSPR